MLLMLVIIILTLGILLEQVLDSSFMCELQAVMLFVDYHMLLKA